MSIAVTFLQQGGQRPETIVGQLADFLRPAARSLHLAVYDFRLSEALAAPLVAVLRERAAAGVDVRIAYDAGKPGLHPGVDPKPPGTAEFLKSLGAGIALKAITGGDPHQPRLMHQKYALRDGAAVWTGSTNLTDDALSLQENNIVVVDSPELCACYETDFAELWQRGDIGTTGRHDTGHVQIGAAGVGVAFAPGEGRSIDLDIAHHIRTTRRRLKLCSMLVTSGAILGALTDVLTAGRLGEYGGIYDRTQMEGVFQQWQGTPAERKWPLFEQVAQGLAGKKSTPYSPSTPHDFMHNKVVVCDDTVITGSYNLSHSATENAENSLMIRDPELADRYVAYIDELVRRYGSGVY